jgi:regulator of protease activity HflC (stomatin/prohibitin superfamily)
MVVEESNLLWLVKYVFVAVVVIALLWIFNPIEQIQAGEVGVVYDAFRGLLPETMQTGWHWKTPVLQTVYHVRVSRDTVTMFGVDYQKDCVPYPECDDIAVEVPSKEGLSVKIDVSVFYKVKPDKAVEVIKTLTADYKTGTVIPSIRSATRDVAGGMAFTELYGEGRKQLEDGIYNNLYDEFDADGLILEQVLIRDVTLPDEIKKSIEDKQATQQQFLQKQFELQKQELEAQRIIIEANGTAEAIKIQGNALRTNPEVLQLRAIDKWNGVMPLSTSGALPFINIQPSQQAYPYVTNLTNP